MSCICILQCSGYILPHVCLAMTYLYNVQQCISFSDSAILLFSWWHLKCLMLLPASYENWVDFRIVRIKQNSFHSCTIKSSFCDEIWMHAKTSSNRSWNTLRCAHVIWQEMLFQKEQSILNMLRSQTQGLLFQLQDVDPFRKKQ